MRNMNTIYIHPKCTTCKKALDFLKSHSINITIKDITAHPPTKKELSLMLSYMDHNLRKLVNTSGNLYKELHLKDRIESIDENELIELLSINGVLVKRPFLLIEGQGVTGFNEDLWKKLFS